MKLLYDIVKKLKKQEIRQVRHIIKTSVFEFEKVGRLFDLITRYQEKDESFYSQKIYNTPPNNTFRVTKSRLKRMLENVILNDKSLSGNESAAINASVQAKKKLLQGKILLGRGAYAASKNLLLQVISSAKKYDLHDDHFQAELLLYRNQSTKTSVKDFQKSTNSLLELNRIRSLVDESVILHYSISNLLANRTLKREGLVEVREKIDRMHNIMEETQHPLAKNVYFLSEVFYHQVANQFEKARFFCEKYLDLLRKEPSQFTTARVGNAYLQSAQVSLQLGKVETARQYSEKVLSIFPEKEINYLLALELAFRIEFYAKSYNKAYEVIRKALNHPQFSASPNVAAKWHYFQSCLLFKMKKFKDAYLELNSTTPLLADKYGMNLHIRLLEIVIMHEMGNYDLMETKILNMRQFVKRTQKKHVLVRPMTLIRILMAWHKSSYDFEHTFLAIKPELNQLAQLEKEHPFRTSDFELIRLEKWMKEKVEI